MFRNIKMKKFLYHLFLSYVVLVVLLSSMSIIVYKSAYEEIGKKSIDIGMRTAENYKDAVDAMFLDAEELTLQLMQEKRIQTISDFEVPLDEEQKNEGLLLASDIEKYTLPKRSYSNIFIYFPSNNLIAHRYGIYDASYFYRIHYKSEDFSYEDFIDVLKDEKRSYIILKSTVATEPEYSQLVYIREAVNKSEYGNTSTSVVCIPEIQLFQNLQHTSEIESKMFILNADKEILFSSDKEYKNILEKEDFELGHNISSRINSGKDTVVCMKSDVVDWYYMVVVPTELLQKDVANIKKLMLFNILLMVVVGVVLIILFVKINYKPVDTLLDQLKNMGLPIDKKGDELEEVYNAVSTISKERNTMGSVLENQKKILKFHALRELIRGKKADIELLREKCDITFPYEGVTVCTFFAKNLDMLFYEDNDLDSYDRKELFFQIIKNIIEELVNRHHKGYVVEVDGMITCIINVNDERTDHFFDDISINFQEAKRAINKYFHIDVIAAMGQVHKGVAGISLAYQESLQTIDYMTFMGLNGLASYSSVPEYNQTETYFSVENEKRLINLIMSGDVKTAEELINDIFDSNLIDGNVSVKGLNTLMMKIVTVYLTVMQSPQLNEENILHKEIGDLMEIIGTESFRIVQSKSIEVLRHICDLALKNKKNSNSSKVSEIVAFIDKNYFMSGLNVNMIADNFGFNTAYLSKMFKDEYGEGLLYYINKARINKAKELLRENKHTIEKIAEMVGFTNTRTFNRAFKRYEGVSPSSYSENYGIH